MRRLGILLALAAVLAGCTSPQAGPGPAATTDTPADATGSEDGRVFVSDVGFGALAGDAALKAFDSCEALLSYYQNQAVELVGPYGLGGGDFRTLSEGDAVDSLAGDGAAGAVPAPAAETAAQTAPGQPFSGTNIQEEGVDEPDLVKTNGSILVTVTGGGRLHVVDVAGNPGAILAQRALDPDSWSHELLLAGTDLYVLSTGGASGPQPLIQEDAALVPAYGPTRTTVTRFDLTDPANPTEIGRLRIEGEYRSARLVGGAIRLVLVSRPTGLAFAQPTDSGLAAEDEATARNEAIIRASGLDAWVPHYEVDDGTPQRLLDCGAVGEPAEFAGFATLSVVTLQTGADLTPTSAAGVVAEGDTVYASTSSLYVATSPWGQWVVPFVDQFGQPSAAEITTDLHRFDISDPAATTYIASGTVPGTVVNQFALSEHNGYLRVATTSEPDWVSTATSESQVVVLTTEGDQLVETGRVGGLGLTERIYSVRYLGDLAAVVTFRQTDPLYLLDLADPAAPRQVGELHIPGFSSYLHPVADGYLLGVGQDADPATGAQLGLQVSLFDVRDPTNPQRTAQVQFGQGYSEAEYDHRAFTFWEATGTAYLPAELYPPFVEPTVQPDGTVIEPPYQPPFTGVIGIAVEGSALRETGRGSVGPELPAGTDPATVYVPAPRRSVVVGEVLYLVSDVGVGRADLTTLSPLGFTGF